eukprot:TRINITY_DN26766_c0_g1_i1.p1 TRINITY_DN26766_c0_g1~~TRINITY_DN26766_c0_g1_i1.p1  ORF type:complete len:395 (+),score=111.66 TRINITY_DN26766_c0_g1_i1:112-1296(+)
MGPASELQRRKTHTAAGSWFAPAVVLPKSKKVLNALDYFARDDVLATVKAGRRVTTSNWIGALLSVALVALVTAYSIILYEQYLNAPHKMHSETLWTQMATEPWYMPVHCLPGTEPGCLVTGVLSKTHPGGVKCRKYLQKELHPVLIDGCVVVRPGETYLAPVCYSGGAEDGVVIIYPAAGDAPEVISDAYWNNGSSMPMGNPVFPGFDHTLLVHTENYTLPEKAAPGEIFDSGRQRYEFFTQHVRNDQLDWRGTCAAVSASGIVPPPPSGRAWPAMRTAVLMLTPAYTHIVVYPRGSFFWHLTAEIGGILGIITSACALVYACYMAAVGSVALLQKCMPHIPGLSDDPERKVLPILDPESSRKLSTEYDTASPQGATSPDGPPLAEAATPGET